eukprot:1510475-Alexandrium_andersonii.AAC.1
MAPGSPTRARLGAGSGISASASVSAPGDLVAAGTVPAAPGAPTTPRASSCGARVAGKTSMGVPGGRQHAPRWQPGQGHGWRWAAPPAPPRARA